MHLILHVIQSLVHIYLHLHLHIHTYIHTFISINFCKVFVYNIGSEDLRTYMDTNIFHGYIQRLYLSICQMDSYHLVVNNVESLHTIISLVLTPTF